MDRFTFSRDEDGNLKATDAVKRAVGVELERSPGLMPRSIVHAAQDELVRKAKVLQFTSGKSYEACANHLMEQDPWLRVATAHMAEDSIALKLGIDIVDGDGQ